MYVHMRSEPGLWTVGHHDPKGTWHPESDHDDEAKAAARVIELNGGRQCSEMLARFDRLLARVNEMERWRATLPERK